MTVVVGINCKDGIVIACDSQVEFHRGAPVKRMNANKIYKLDGDIAIAGAGMVVFIEKAVNNLKHIIEKKEEATNEKLSLEDIVDIAEGVMLDLHKVYDIDREMYLRSDIKSKEGQDFVNMHLMMGGVDRGSDKNHLYSLYKDGIAEPVSDYATAGSGAPYAEYLLSRYYFPDINVNIGKKLGIYIIKETEKIDPNVGGSVNIAGMDKTGYHEMDEKEVVDIYEDIRGKEEYINRLMINSIIGKLKIEDLKKLSD